MAIVEVLGKVECRRWGHAGLCVRVVLDQESTRLGRPRMLFYHATLGVPESAVRTFRGVAGRPPQCP